MTANYLFFSCLSLTKKHPLLQGHTPLSEKAEELRKKGPGLFFFRTDLVTKGRHLVFSNRIYFSHDWPQPSCLTTWIEDSSFRPNYQNKPHAPVYI